MTESQVSERNKLILEIHGAISAKLNNLNHKENLVISPEDTKEIRAYKVLL